MDKTGVYKLYKNEKYGVLLGSITSNWSVNVNFFFFFSFFFCLFFFCFCFFCFLFFCSGSTSAFYFLTLVPRSVWKPKNRSVWISVLCRHKFHLLQINSSEIIWGCCHFLSRLFLTLNSIVLLGIMLIIMIMIMILRKSVLKFIMTLFFVILFKPAPNCIWVVTRTMLVYKHTR